MQEANRGRGQALFEQANEDAGSSEFQPLSAEHLISQMRETADKFLRDGASRGDLKLVNTALKELRYCFKVFRPFRDLRKVTVFGSARLPPSDGAYQAAVAFGKRMADAGFMVVTGAAAGIMEAGHVGAGREHSIGINILLPFEQSANPIIDGDRKLMHLKYFFTRKLLFVKESDAVAPFPGGFGTLDEGFEVLTLIQTGKSHLFPIVLVDEPGGVFWVRWQEFIRDVLLARKLISEEDLSLYRIVESVDEAVEEILSFYHCYHSMRYVGRELVLRLRQRIDEASLDQIRTDFKDILSGGTFEQGEALPLEGEEFPELNRLRFCFNRRNMGRLRQLIDFINQKAKLLER
ncbi:MAG: LOG family protein [Gemmataceae bacterium]